MTFDQTDSKLYFDLWGEDSLFIGKDEFTIDCRLKTASLTQYQTNILRIGDYSPEDPGNRSYLKLEQRNNRLCILGINDYATSSNGSWYNLYNAWTNTDIFNHLVLKVKKTGLIIYWNDTNEPILTYQLRPAVFDEPVPARLVLGGDNSWQGTVKDLKISIDKDPCHYILKNSLENTDALNNSIVGTDATAIENVTTWPDGGINFNGIDSRVKFNLWGEDDFLIGRDEFIIDFRVKTNDINQYQKQLLKIGDYSPSDPGNRSYLLLEQRDNRLCIFGMNEYATSSNNSGYNIYNVWTDDVNFNHIVLQANRTHLKIFLNDISNPVVVFKLRDIVMNSTVPHEMVLGCESWNGVIKDVSVSRYTHPDTQK